MDTYFSAQMCLMAKLNFEITFSSIYWQYIMVPTGISACHNVQQLFSLSALADICVTWRRHRNLYKNYQNLPPRDLSIWFLIILLSLLLILVTHLKKSSCQFFFWKAERKFQNDEVSDLFLNNF